MKGVTAQLHDCDTRGAGEPILDRALKGVSHKQKLACPCQVCAHHTATGVDQDVIPDRRAGGITEGDGRAVEGILAIEREALERDAVGGDRHRHSIPTGPFDSSGCCPGIRKEGDIRLVDDDPSGIVACVHDDRVSPDRGIDPRLDRRIFAAGTDDIENGILVLKPHRLDSGENVDARRNNTIETCQHDGPIAAGHRVITAAPGQHDNVDAGSTINRVAPCARLEKIVPFLAGKDIFTAVGKQDVGPGIGHHKVAVRTSHEIFDAGRRRQLIGCRNRRRKSDGEIAWVDHLLCSGRQVNGHRATKVAQVERVSVVAAIRGASHTDSRLEEPCVFNNHVAPQIGASKEIGIAAVPTGEGIVACTTFNDITAIGDAGRIKAVGEQLVTAHGRFKATDPHIVDPISGQCEVDDAWIMALEFIITAGD